MRESRRGIKRAYLIVGIEWGLAVLPDSPPFIFSIKHVATLFFPSACYFRNTAPTGRSVSL
jgi:hypothetical protein